MNNENTNIYLDYNGYNKIFNVKSKQIIVNVNYENIVFCEDFINYFIENKDCFKILNVALKNRKKVSIILSENNEILLKNEYSPVSIILALKYKEELLDLDSKREFRIMLNRINIDNYIKKNANQTYSLSFDGKLVKTTYGEILEIILDSEKYEKFIDSDKKYGNLLKYEYIYLLKQFIIEKNIFITFELKKQSLDYYSYLVRTYDTYAINEYLKTNFKYSDNIEINSKLESKLLEGIPKNIPSIEKIIYIYLNMFQILKIDFDFPSDTHIKRHKDLTHIEEITDKNNKVLTYEFSCLFAKMLEKLNINFDYKDKYITARINKYIIKFKAIADDFNADVMLQSDILRGITLLNNNMSTKKDFNDIIYKIYKKIYSDKINLKILEMPFNELIDLYKTYSRKISLSFEKKYDIFMKLIKNVNLENNAIGYIYEIKNLIFNKNELDSNISFATISEVDDGKIVPIVIITVNYTNINLYNSNKYIYYNPPKKIKTYTLNEIRLQFFNGNFQYIKGNKDNIIGVEKGKNARNS